MPHARIAKRVHPLLILGLVVALAGSPPAAPDSSSPRGAAPTQEGKTAAGEPKQQPRDSSKVITLKGSDTMVILAQRWAEAFMKKHPDAKVQVMGGGSGTGLAALINGTTDIATCSRPAKPKEKADFAVKYNRPVKEVPVALDGIAVYVHPENPLPSLTLEQLKGIFTGGIKDWKEVGGKPGSIVAYGRENSSGTYSFFKEHVLENKDFSAETQTLQGTAAIINAVSKDVRGIGYGGIGYSHGVSVLPLAQVASSPPVPPSEKNVDDGSYPLSRNLYFCLDPQKDQGPAKEFIEFCLSSEGQNVVQDVGYYPLRREPLEKQEKKDSK